MAQARILARQVLSHVRYLLEKVTIERQRSDGKTQTISREVFDTGQGAVILLYDPTRGRVALIKQFRLPVFVSNGEGHLIEAVAGKLEGEDPAVRIVMEVEEEAGFKIEKPVRIFEAFMSPGSVTEKLTFFVVRYRPEDRVGPGGGLADEGEDIEVIEPTLDEALAMIESGEICDAKTIALLYYAKVKGLMNEA
ncbi:NUDIX domain-containing protein [Methyloferula stellata]|uniref:NUDIX domain-containing protein n=1 Tax=Methyloferula stellata TaxID=876270 RepID=UPI00038199F6|nr:NUDIX domain-containing protein [Methyloferula stellata]